MESQRENLQKKKPNENTNSQEYIVRITKTELYIRRETKNEYTYTIQNHGQTKSTITFSPEQKMDIPIQFKITDKTKTYIITRAIFYCH